MTDDVWRTRDILDAARRSGGPLKSEQTTMGFSLNEHGVLADKDLRPARILAFCAIACTCTWRAAS
eukprot:2968604-Pyramimonas_sp.AAC.1